MNMLVVFPTSKTQAPNKNQQGAAKEIKEKVIVGKIDLEFFNFALLCLKWMAKKSCFSSLISAICH